MFEVRTWDNGFLNLWFCTLNFYQLLPMYFFAIFSAWLLPCFRDFGFEVRWIRHLSVNLKIGLMRPRHGASKGPVTGLCTPWALLLNRCTETRLTQKNMENHRQSWKIMAIIIMACFGNFMVKLYLNNMFNSLIGFRLLHFGIIKS